MALPLFWRLILGYAAILVLSIGSSIYAVDQLGELSETARGVLDTDYRTIAYQESLTDTFLSEARYGGKYLLTQSPSSYDQFRQFKKDFLRYQSELKAMVSTVETTTQLRRVEQFHQSFHELFEQEVKYIKAGQPYAQSRYQQERGKILDNTLRELALLKELLEKNLHGKLEGLGGTARAARNIAIAATLILLITGTALSLKISTSVTKPLQDLTNISKNASADEHTAKPLSSIPEIHELSVVVAQQRQRLLGTALDNAGRVERVTEDLAASLASHKKQLDELKVAIGPALSPQGKALIDPVIEDTDRLVQYCAELHASTAARTEVMKLAPQTARERDSDPTSHAAHAWLMRELPVTQAACDSATTRITARCASILAPLVRQLRRHEKDSDKQNT